MIGEMLSIADAMEPALREELIPFADIAHGAFLEVDELWARSQLPAMNSESETRRFLWDTLVGNPTQHQAVPPQTRLGKSYLKERGFDSSPFRIRVALKHAVPPAMQQRLPKSVSASELPTMPIVYEVRPPIKATRVFESLARVFKSDARGAPSIGIADPPSAGTAGGLIRGLETGRSYVISCGHVLGAVGGVVYSPGPHEGKEGRACGRVVYSRLPRALPPDTSCTETRGNGGSLDLAIAELDDAGESGLLQRVRPTVVRSAATLRSFQPAFFRGKVSGYVEAQVGGVALWYPLLFADGTTRCIGRIFELMPRPDGPVEVAREGDSGAFICDRAGDVICWDGLLIGVSRGRAYACFAEYAMDEIQSWLGAAELYR